MKIDVLVKRTHTYTQKKGQVGGRREEKGFFLLLLLLLFLFCCSPWISTLFFSPSSSYVEFTCCVMIIRHRKEKSGEVRVCALEINFLSLSMNNVVKKKTFPYISLRQLLKHVQLQKTTTTTTKKRFFSTFLFYFFRFSLEKNTRLVILLRIKSLIVFSLNYRK